MFLLSHMLKRFVQIGTLNVIGAEGKLHQFVGAPGPTVTLRLHDRGLPLKIFLKPELAVGEAYVDGTLTFERCTVYDLLHLFAVNRRGLGAYPLQKAVRWCSRKLRSFHQYNPIAKSRQNVAHHYDLSRELYELFLDQDLQYTCAYFENPDDTLEQAQENKKRHVAAKLRLAPGQTVLEMGCGWGGLALYLADAADVDVTAVTLSEEQYKVSVERAQSLGLTDRVQFRCQDYREVKGRFDRVVSIGMLEHVGVRHYDELFAKVRDLLTDDGVALIHAIGKKSPPGTAGPRPRRG